MEIYNFRTDIFPFQSLLRLNEVLERNRHEVNHHLF